MASRVKIKQITSRNELFGKVLVSDGNSGLTFVDESELTVIGKGTSFPVSPTGGTLYYRTDVDILFQYDYSRSKWLSVDTHTLTCGRASITADETTYYRIGDATQSSVVGFRMIKNGTIVGASVTNTNSLTVARNVEVRVNNSAVNKVTMTILTGTTGTSVSNFNLDFSVGDLLQVVAIADGTGAALDNTIVVIDVAYRI
jgi:hypothetical protein